MDKIPTPEDERKRKAVLALLELKDTPAGRYGAAPFTLSARMLAVRHPAPPVMQANPERYDGLHFMVDILRDKADLCGNRPQVVASPFAFGVVPITQSPTRWVRAYARDRAQWFAAHGSYRHRAPLEPLDLHATTALILGSPHDIDWRQEGRRYQALEPATAVYMRNAIEAQRGKDFPVVVNG